MCRQGGQIRRYKDTLKNSFKRLQINPSNWEDLARDRPTWRGTVKTGAAIYEANRIAAAKVKREARKSQLCPPRNANVQLPPTCQRCQRTFRAPIGLVGQLRTNCTTRTAPTVLPPSTSFSSSAPPTYSDRHPEPPHKSSSTFSFSPTTTSAAVTSVKHINTTHNPDTPKTPNPPPSTRVVWTGLYLSSLRPHLHLTHRTGRSLANPSHRDWRTSAWSTNLCPPHPPSLFTLPFHVRALHGPIRPHAYTRERN
ncbi:hypothetical protein SprV_0100373000 [Sparganum proliferum]